MKVNKKTILENICYTELVYGRVNKKLKVNYSKQQIEAFIFKILSETAESSFTRSGKNYHVKNPARDIRVTINSSTFRVITVDRINK